MDETVVQVRPVELLPGSLLMQYAPLSSQLALLELKHDLNAYTPFDIHDHDVSQHNVLHHRLEKPLFHHTLLAQLVYLVRQQSLPFMWANTSRYWMAAI